MISNFKNNNKIGLLIFLLFAIFGLIDETYALTCLYTDKGATRIEIVINEDNGTISAINQNSQDYNVNISKSDFVSDGNYYCPYKMYRHSEDKVAYDFYNDPNFVGPVISIRLTDPQTGDYIYEKNSESGQEDNSSGTDNSGPTRNDLNGGFNNNGNIDNCQALFGERTQKLLKSVFTMIKYLGPTLTGVFTIIDLIRAAMSGEADEMKKVYKKFSKRIVSAILLFFVPTLIDFLFQAVDLTSPNSCLDW